MDVLEAEIARRVPDLTGLEFALLIAAYRAPGITPGAACVRVADWFMVPLELPEVTRAVRRLTFKGYLELEGETLRPSPAAIDPTTQMLGGLIRLIDNGRGHFDVALLAHLAARKDANHGHLV